MSESLLVATVAGMRGIRIFEVCLDVAAKSPHFRKPKFESCGHRSQPGRSDLNTTVCLYFIWSDSGQKQPQTTACRTFRRHCTCTCWCPCYRNGARGVDLFLISFTCFRLQVPAIVDRILKPAAWECAFNIRVAGTNFIQTSRSSGVCILSLEKYYIYLDCLIFFPTPRLRPRLAARLLSCLYSSESSQFSCTEHVVVLMSESVVFR
jgi:hypothetical protein